MNSLFLHEQHIALEAAAPFVGGDVLSIERFPGGMNHVFKITGNACSVIVRVNQERDLEHALTEHRKELWCLEHTRTHGIPGPEILDAGLMSERAYMVYTFIPGDAGDQLLNTDVGTLEVLQYQIRDNITALGEVLGLTPFLSNSPSINKLTP